MRRDLLSATAALALLSNPAIGQQSFDLGTLVLSDGFGETTLEETGASVSVVTREEIEASGDVRVSDLLARLPGVDVRARGSLGSQTSIAIRGAGQNYVRVLVDGIDVSDVSAPQHAFDFGSLTTSDIARIEVLRGGQSAIYGSEAIGGVINITTRRAEEEGVSQFANLEVGSYATLRGSYGVSANLGDLDYSLSLSRTITDGFSAADENNGNTEADGYASTRLSFSLGHDLAGGARVGFNGFVQHAKFDFDEQFPIGDGTPDDTSDNESIGLRAFVEMQTGPIDSTFTATYHEIERDVSNASSFGPFDTLADGRTIGVSYLGVAALSDSTELRFGADYKDQEFSLVTTFGSDAGQEEIFGLFGELAYTPTDGFDLSATLRHDDHSRFGGLTSGRIALAWQPAADYILRASLASSFRAPSLYELYYSFGGNLALQPEESDSIDIGVERRLGADSFVRVTAFRNETTNLIDYVAGNYTQIPGTVERYGVELEFGAALNERWRLDGSYTRTEMKNPTLSAGNAWNLEYPEHDVSLTLSGAITDKLTSSFSVQAVSDRPTLPDYVLAHAMMSYAVTDAVDAYLRVDNLFDEEYQTTASYGTSDRALYLGFRARF